MYVRRACVDLLDAAWGVGLLCHRRGCIALEDGLVSLATHVSMHDAFSYRFALLLAVDLCWVDRGFDSWVLLGLLCNVPR